MLAKLISAIAAATIACAAAAQEVRVYGSDERVDPGEVARILEGQREAPQIKYRSLRLLDDKGATATAARPQASALALPVQFAFDSAQILPSARSQLDAIARGIGLLAPSKPVMIEGYTDAVGSEDYNLDLSVRRAQAVKQYLVRVHGIDAGRLKTVGFGKDRPLETKNPYAAENRRVQFRGA